MCIFDAALNSSCRFKDSQAKINVWPKNVRFVFKMVPHASQIKPSKRSVRVCNVIYYIITMNDILNKIAIPSKQDPRKKTPSAWQLHIIMVAKDILRKLARKKSIWWLNHDTHTWCQCRHFWENSFIKYPANSSLFFAIRKRWSNSIRLSPRP